MYVPHSGSFYEMFFLLFKELVKQINIDMASPSKDPYELNSAKVGKMTDGLLRWGFPLGRN